MFNIIEAYVKYSVRSSVIDIIYLELMYFSTWYPIFYLLSDIFFANIKRCLIFQIDCSLFISTYQKKILNLFIREVQIRQRWFIVTRPIVSALLNDEYAVAFARKKMRDKK